jgi:uncharacterized membrane protein SirB2
VAYLVVRTVHQSAVALSIAGFVVRGLLSLAGSRLAATPVAKTLPHLVDTVLLVSALALAWMLRLDPIQAPWLQAKIAGLVLYIALGSVALGRGGSRKLRAAAWIGALATVAWIASVAITKSPFGAFAALR